MVVSLSTLFAISMAWSERVFRPWAVMSISKEGNRSVRTVTPTLTATTMAMNTTLSRVDMPPRLNRLEVKGFFHFRLAGLPFFCSTCFVSFCFVSIVFSLL